MCHAYLLHVGADAKSLVFMRIYSYARSMMAAMFIEIPLFVLRWHLGKTISVELIVISLILCGLSYAFYTLFKHYDKTFTREVLQTFFMKTTKKPQNP